VAVEWTQRLGCSYGATTMGVTGMFVVGLCGANVGYQRVE
jgi:hypothetical protein